MIHVNYEISTRVKVMRDEKKYLRNVMRKRDFVGKF
jgi:hypothetical protein